jgi:hypothetical protein
MASSALQECAIACSLLRQIVHVANSRVASDATLTEKGRHDECRTVADREKLVTRPQTSKQQPFAFVDCEASKPFWVE